MQTLIIPVPRRPAPVIPISSWLEGTGFGLAVGIGIILLSMLGKKNGTGTDTTSASVAQRRHALAGRR